MVRRTNTKANKQTPAPSPQRQRSARTICERRWIEREGRRIDNDVCCVLHCGGGLQHIVPYCVLCSVRCVLSLDVEQAVTFGFGEVYQLPPVMRAEPYSGQTVMGKPARAARVGSPTA
jgi:hypothetical protein